MYKKTKAKQSLLLSASLILALFTIATILNASESAGLTPTGTQGVSLNTGSLIYSYPIELPKGRGSINPNLNISYASQGGNGFLGLGFNIETSIISRSTKNGIPKYDDTDKFEFNGQELVEILSSNYGYKEYRTKIESNFSRFRYYCTGDSDINDNILEHSVENKKWKVWDKTGKVYEFEGLLLNPNQDEHYSEYFSWKLVKITDTNSNYMTITYQSSGFPQYIKYTGHGSELPKTEIEFILESRNDVITSYRAGVENKIDQRLKYIIVKSTFSTPISKYELCYSTTSAKLSYINAIKHYYYNADGSLTTPLITNFIWNNQTFGYTETSSFVSPTEFVKRFNNKDSRYEGCELVDVDGNGLVDIVQYLDENNKGAWINTGTGFSPDSSWIPPVPLAEVVDTYNTKDEGVRFVDLNGDGKADILRSCEGKYNDAWINNGNGWSPASSDWYLPSISTGIYFTANNGNAKNTTLVDVNGDGRPDIVAIADSSYTYVNTGSGWQPSDNWHLPVKILEGVRFADLNGDGLIDILQGFESSSNRHAWLNTGKGWVNADSPWASPVVFQYKIHWNGALQSDEGARLGDINGDGLADIVQYRQGAYGTDLRAWLNTRNGWLRDDNWLTPERFVETYKQDIFGNVLTADDGARLIDINGDGLTDVIKGCDGDLSVYDEHTAWINNCTPYFCITKITNELGGKESITYDIHIQKNTDLPFPITVVKEKSTYDGLQSTVTLRYEYMNGLLDKTPYEEREFLGFRQVKTIDALDNYTLTNFLQDDDAINEVNVKKGQIDSIETHKANGDMLTKVINQISFTRPFGESIDVYFPHVDRIFNKLYENNQETKNTITDYTYDGYGNVLSVFFWGEGTGLTGDELVTETEYVPCTNDNYIVGLPVSKKISDGTINGLKSEAKYYYGSDFSQNNLTNTNLTKTTAWQGGTTYLTVSTITYNSYGNIIAQTDANQNTTVFEYDANQLNVEKITNALGHSEHFSYNAQGKIITHTSINNQITKNSYDSFGRPVKIWGTLDSEAYPSVEYSYIVSDNFPEVKHKVIKKSRITHGQAGTLDTYSFYDGLGRTYQTKSPYTEGKQIVSGGTAYDALGRKEKEYLPISVNFSDSPEAFVDTMPHTTIQYDDHGKVWKVIKPDTTYTEKTYSGFNETVKDENVNSTTYIKNALGKITSVVEPTSVSTDYEYDTLGNLKKITHAMADPSTGKNTTEIEYDTLGRKIKMNDWQMGEWSYKYDDNGNLTVQTDALLHGTTMQYDCLNRIIEKRNNDSLITYTYDEGFNAKGRLTSVQESKNSILTCKTTYTYDNAGNVVCKSRTIDGVTYNSISSFDALGRDLSLTYPSGEKVNNHYSASALAYVTNSDNSLNYASLNYNYTTAPGKLSSVLYNNNAITTSYGYDENMHRLTSLSTVNGTIPLQSFSYEYEPNGNIKYINKNQSNEQYYEYDSLNRLTYSRAPGYTKTYQYDDVGNILQSSEETQRLQNGYWGSMESLAGLTATNVSLFNGRYGQGLLFAAGSTAEIDYSENINLSNGLSVEYFAMPYSLSGEYAVSKEGSFKFGKIGTNSISAYIKTITGEYTVTATANVKTNTWQHFAMTYDNAGNLKIYLNGSLIKTENITGAIVPSTNKVVLGNGYTGRLDELGLWTSVLSPSEISAIYGAAPNFTPNQPETPADRNLDAYGNVIAQKMMDTIYKFRFQAKDIDGDNIKYHIDWDYDPGTGQESSDTFDTDYVASGQSVEAEKSWHSTGVHYVRVKAIQNVNNVETGSAWSPYLGVTVVPDIDGKLQESMIGNAAEASEITDSNIHVDWTAGETVVGLCESVEVSTKAILGYGGTISQKSLYWRLVSGEEGTGGNETTPPSAKEIITQEQTLAYTQTPDISKGLRQNITVKAKDANGNTLLSNGRRIFFDADNRIVRIVMANGTEELYTYDFEGTRIRKTVNSGQCTVVSDTLYIGTVWEKNLVTNENINNIYAGGQKVAIKKSNGTLRYLYPDHLGSMRMMTDGAGTVKRSVAYKPFGQSTVENNTEYTDTSFTGQKEDSTTGLYFYNARYMDPVTGRFLTCDPYIQEPYDPQTLNRYAYCRNNPIIYTDPSGHFLWIPVVVGVIMGGTHGNPFDENNWNNFDWIGAAIGGISGAVGGSLGEWAYASAGGGAAGMAASGIVGGWGAGSVGGGLTAWRSGGDIMLGAMMGGAYGMTAGMFTAGLGAAGVTGAIGSAGGSWMAAYMMSGGDPSAAWSAAGSAFAGNLIAAGLNAYTPLDKSGSISDINKNRETNALESAMGKQKTMNKLALMQNMDTVSVTTPQMKSLDDVIWNSVALLIGNGYSHTWHSRDAAGSDYLPHGGYYKIVESGVRHVSFKGVTNLFTGNCTSRFGYTHPGSYNANHNYSTGYYQW